MKRQCFFAAALLLCLLLRPASAAVIPEGVQEALPGEAREQMELLEDQSYDHRGLLHGLGQIWDTVRRSFFSLFRENIRSAVVLLGVVLICGVLDDLYQAAGSGSVSNFVPLSGALLITLVAAGNAKSLIGMGLEALEALDIFAKALLPTLAAAVAASGGAVTAAGHQVSTVLFTNLLLSLIRHCLLPMVYFYIALAAAGAMLPQSRLKFIQNAVGKGVTWTLTGVLVVFTGYLTLSGAVSGSADAVAMYLTRSVISTAVPVVGGIIADATATVLSAGAVLKGAVGVFGMLGVLMICLTPFLHLSVQYILYKLTAFLASAVGSPPLVELINALGSAFGLVLGMTGACALLLLISIASSVSVVVGG